MRIVCVSDTHNATPDLPDGDILIHAGDLTVRGYRIEVYRQLGWLELNRHRYKEVIVVPGNHDLYFEERWAEAEADCMAADIRLLHNAEIEVAGLRIYGSAHTPNYHDWAFMLGSAQIAAAWDRIPQGLDVLVTHGPPASILDESYRGPIGCPLLREAVDRVAPRCHIFGHAHAGRGMRQENGTLFVNTACGVTTFDL
jgi:Icc-related predicted phosphoesterase